MPHLKQRTPRPSALMVPRVGKVTTMAVLRARMEASSTLYSCTLGLG